MFIKKSLIFILLLVFTSCGIMRYNSKMEKATKEYNKKNYSVSINLVTDAIGIYSKSGLGYYLRGVSFLFLHEYRKAIYDLTKSLDFIERGDAVVYFTRAAAFYSLGEYGKSINDYQTYIKKSKNFTEAYYNLACVYWKMGKRKKAFETCDYVINSHLFGYDAIIYLKSYFYFDQKLFKKALVQINLSLNVANHYRFVREGRLYLLRGVIYKFLQQTVKQDNDFMKARKLLRQIKKEAFYKLAMLGIKKDIYTVFGEPYVLPRISSYLK